MEHLQDKVQLLIPELSPIFSAPPSYTDNLVIKLSIPEYLPDRQMKLSPISTVAFGEIFKQQRPKNDMVFGFLNLTRLRKHSDLW